jgi:hypothetical protein
LTIEKLTSQQRSKIGLVRDINIKEILSRIIIVNDNLSYLRYCAKRMWQQFVKFKQINDFQPLDFSHSKQQHLYPLPYHQLNFLQQMDESILNKNSFNLSYDKNSLLYYEGLRKSFSPHFMLHQFGFSSLSTVSVDNIIKFIERKDRVQQILNKKSDMRKSPNLEKFVSDLKLGKILFRSEGPLFSRSNWNPSNYTDLDSYFDQYQ